MDEAELKQRKNGVESYNIKDALDGRKDGQEIFLDSMHVTELGNRLIAAQIFKSMFNRKLPEANALAEDSQIWQEYHRKNLPNENRFLVISNELLENPLEAPSSPDGIYTLLPGKHTVQGLKSVSNMRIDLEFKCSSVGDGFHIYVNWAGIDSQAIGLPAVRPVSCDITMKRRVFFVDAPAGAKRAGLVIENTGLNPIFIKKISARAVKKK